MGLECGLGGGFNLSGWPGKTHVTWSIKAAAPGETGDEVKQIEVKAGGRAGRTMGTERWFHDEWKIGNIDMRCGRWRSYTRSLHREPETAQKAVSEAGLRGLFDCFVEGGEEGMRLQAVLSLDNEDNGGVLAGSPPTALHTVRGAVHVDRTANPISPGGTGTTCKAAQPRLWETEHWERQCSFWKKKYLLSSGTAEAEGQRKIPLPRSRDCTGSQRARLGSGIWKWSAYRCSSLCLLLKKQTNKQTN